MDMRQCAGNQFLHHHTFRRGYLPMLIQWMRKAKDQNPLRRFIMPSLAMCGSIFMVVACIFSHGIGCLWYLIVFTVIMLIGFLIDAKKK